MSLGAEAVFVGSGIFKSDDPESRAAVLYAKGEQSGLMRKMVSWFDRVDDLEAAINDMDGAS